MILALILAASVTPLTDALRDLSNASQPTALSPTAVPAANASAGGDGTSPIPLGAAPLDRHDRVLHYLAWQTAGAAVDLWSTGYCIDRNPRCREGNPLAGNGHPLQITALKLVHISAFAYGANELERHGQHRLAVLVNVFGVFVQVAAASNNFWVAGHK